MHRRIPDETKQLMQKLFAEGLSVAEIARRTNTPYTTTYSHTKAVERGFASPINYSKHLAEQKGFESLTARQDYLARKRGFKSRIEYQRSLVENKGYNSLYEYKLALIKKKGFNSEHEYQKYLATKNGFESLAAYRLHMVQQKGFDTFQDYQKHLAEQKGFESLEDYNNDFAVKQGFDSYLDYQKHLAEERQKLPLNQAFSALLRQRLDELGHTQKWLTEQLGVSQGVVSRYISGRTTPRKSLQGKLFNALELPYKTLDDLMQ